AQLGAAPALGDCSAERRSVGTMSRPPEYCSRQLPAGFVTLSPHSRLVRISDFSLPLLSPGKTTTRLLPHLPFIAGDFSLSTSGTSTRLA
ncbi:hypothetical protein BV25DRAFT_1830997, partial [Artomyces pyxidatus]